MSLPKTKRNQQIAQLRKKGLTLRAIGKVVGVSYERVRQILAEMDVGITLDKKSTRV